MKIPTYCPLTIMEGWLDFSRLHNMDCKNEFQNADITR